MQMNEDQLIELERQVEEQEQQIHMQQKVIMDLESQLQQQKELLENMVVPADSPPESHTLATKCSQISTSNTFDC